MTASANTKRKFTVKLRRVVYAEITVEAATAQQAREQVESEGAHEHFVLSDCIGPDETTVVSVKRKDQQQ